jgi:mannitol/fructose-specific phosphotransferase system IIA component (Ntr-type)
MANNHEQEALSALTNAFSNNAFLSTDLLLVANAEATLALLEEQRRTNELLTILTDRD